MDDRFFIQFFQDQVCCRFFGYMRSNDIITDLRADFYCDHNVFVHELADSAVVLGIRAWVKNEEYWETRWRLLEEIKLLLDENGIEIPYPQMTVHMQKNT